VASRRWEGGESEYLEFNEVREEKMRGSRVHELRSSIFIIMILTSWTKETSMKETSGLSNVSV
jgi:hypothetical protein